MQQPGVPKVQKEWITQNVGLYREGQPSPLDWRGHGRGAEFASQDGPVQVGTEGCRGNLEAEVRFDTLPSAICPGLKPNNNQLQHIRMCNSFRQFLIGHS